MACKYSNQHKHRRFFHPTIMSGLLNLCHRYFMFLFKARRLVLCIQHQKRKTPTHELALWFAFSSSVHLLPPGEIVRVAAFYVDVKEGIK